MAKIQRINEFGEPIKNIIQNENDEVSLNIVFAVCMDNNANDSIFQRDGFKPSKLVGNILNEIAGSVVNTVERIITVTYSKQGSSTIGRISAEGNVHVFGNLNGTTKNDIETAVMKEFEAVGKRLFEKNGVKGFVHVLFE